MSQVKLAFSDIKDTSKRNNFLDELCKLDAELIADSDKQTLELKSQALSILLNFSTGEVAINSNSNTSISAATINIGSDISTTIKGNSSLDLRTGGVATVQGSMIQLN